MFSRKKNFEEFLEAGRAFFRLFFVRAACFIRLLLKNHIGAAAAGWPESEESPAAAGLV